MTDLTSKKTKRLSRIKLRAGTRLNQRRIYSSNRPVLLSSSTWLYRSDGLPLIGRFCSRRTSRYRLVDTFIMVKPSTEGSLQKAVHVDATLPKLREHKPARDEQLLFREPGSPAGSFPHTPWWHCCFYDRYERVNIWSHGLPGVVFLMLGLASLLGATAGGKTLATFCFCAATTHILSAMGHVYPDSHVLEKLDHIGIIALILGTPITALLAKEHGHLPTDLMYCSAGMFVAAFLPPTARVLGFATGIIVMIAFHYQKIMTANLVVQLVLYATGGVSFLRNQGHNRWSGLSDHHFLHYCVTAACFMHVWYVLSAMDAPVA